MAVSEPNATKRAAEQVAASLESTHNGMTQRHGASRSLAQLTESRALTTQQLESRHLIHGATSVRASTDAFREIRTRLLELGDSQNFITLVAPVSRGCGASYVARNLAVAFAFDEARTALLIDCDFREPSQHTAFGVEPTNGGLIDYMDHPSVGIDNILYRTGIPRLRLIPAGGAREMSSEYFTSFRMRALLDSLRCRYPDRYLFLDAPSVTESPDARIAADLADFVVLVAGYGRDSPKMIHKAASNFPPAKLAGVVFDKLS